MRAEVKSSDRKNNVIVKKVIRIVFILIIVIFILIGIGYITILNADYGKGFDNYIYSSDFLKNKIAMVIVPHEDDEINVAGATIKNYVDSGSDVIVVFTTNGDYNRLGKLRIDEAINAMAELGVEKDNVVFLGYGDQWDTEYGHIYNAPDDKIIKSHIKEIKTYGNDNVSDFRTILDGEPSLYTRNNFKGDMIDVILKYSPEVIFTVDFDSHIDHRATSLIFEEAMHEILKEHNNYNPQVFKGFAYNTAWYSENDFYSENLESTLKPNNEKIQDSNYEVDLPNYNWNDRIRFLVPRDTLTYTKLNNPIYKALKQHNSQNAKLHAEQIINSDQVFWERSTNSITYDSKIEVSSGEASYINDFKLADTSDISSEKNVKFDKCVWIPEKKDIEKSVKVKFNEGKNIESVSLYDNLSLEDNILSGKLLFSDGSEIEVANLNKNGSETRINFEKKSDIEYVEFKIIEYEGENPGLCELEVFENKLDSNIEYIKLVNDNENETFMYRYIILDEEDIQLNIYSYPNLGNSNILDKCKISILNNKNDSIKIENNSLKVSKNPKPGKYKIRVELLDNPKIFDEVEIVIPNKVQEIYIKYIDDLERFFIRAYYSLRYRLGIDRLQ